MMHRFTQLDRIVALTSGERIEAVKVLSLAESYLDDHFPLFPVMPGVLMLEAMYQAGAWLIRHSEDFAHSMVVLREARNVKYSGFVEPGAQLTVTAEIIKQDGKRTTMKARGAVNGRDRDAVAGRFVLERYNLVEQNPARGPIDSRMRRDLREMFSLLYQPRPKTAPQAGE